MNKGVPTISAERAWADEEWASEHELERLRTVNVLNETDPEAARAELKHLAALGSVKSMVFLGTMYRRGQGTPVDLHEAEKWYLRAAEFSYVPANYCLGLIYRRRSYSRRAVEQFRIAADKNYMAAIYMLGEMHYRGDGTTRDILEAKRLWEKGNSFGYIYAKTALAKILLSGKFGLLQWIRGAWLEHEAVILRMLIERKNPMDPRLG